MKKAMNTSAMLVAEGVGTLLLTLVVLLNNPVYTGIPTLILAPVMLLLIALALGPISGAHVNPALTLGALSVGKISLSRAIQYIIAQIVGAILALLLVGALKGNAMDFVNFGNFSANTFWYELIGMVVFSFAVASAMSGRAKEHGAFAVALGLLVGLAIAVSTNQSLGGLNPAVMLGSGKLDLSYLLAPVLGSAIGFWINHWLMHNEDND